MTMRNSVERDWGRLVRRILSLGPESEIVEYKENNTDPHKQVQPSTPTNQQAAKAKTQTTPVRTTPATTNRQQTVQQNKPTTQPTTPKNESSSSWTNFFKRVKESVTGLFE